MPVITNKSKAFNYNYTSLADIVNAGQELPQMRIKPTENGEYIEYLDDKGEWQIGARVVIPDMKGSNDAQKYGAAISYARRYTAQLALKLATTDDQAVETQSAEQAKDNERHDAERPSFDDIKAKLDKMTTVNEVNEYAREINDIYPTPTDKQRWAIRSMFAIRRDQIKEGK